VLERLTDLAAEVGLGSEEGLLLLTDLKAQRSETGEAVGR
jgi:hypothetical protein